MFFLRLKPEEEILETINSYRKLLYIVCTGCNEVNFSIKEAINFFEKYKKIYDLKIKFLDYICNLDFSRNYIKLLQNEIENVQAVIIFSCGVGISTISSIINKKTVLTISDTLHLNGYKGYTTPYYGKFECSLCGSCYLNYTAGICPIANCPKSLLNGPCGGVKNGKCEVDKTKDCIWEKIFFRLKKLNKLKSFSKQILINDYNK